MLSACGIPALRDNYVWLLKGEGDRAVVVDPGEAQPVLDRLETEGLTLAAILVTHHHWDHTRGIAALAARFEVPVYGPAADEIDAVTVPLRDGDRIALAEIGWELEVLSVPGHTRGQAAYYGGGAVFTGDTLFSAGCGRLFEGTAAQMWASLERLRALPARTRMYCGHEYTQANLRFAAEVEPDNPAVVRRRAWVDAERAAGRPTLPSTMGEELEFNPFLRADVDSVRQAAERKTGRSLPTPVAVFAALREWKDNY